jgi:pSer/pThr/pTyr-binding forkhead associated (FHA) protein
LLDAISKSLRDVARENGVYFTREPEFRLQPDPSLTYEGIRVEATEQFEASGHTAAFAAVPTAPQNSSIPLNAFLIVDGNRVFPLNQMVVNIGRRVDNHLVMADPRVSRAHAQIRAIRGQYVLFDLNSTGGTMVNGRRVHQCALKPGDVISLSGVPLIYGEEIPDDNTYEIGLTRSMHNPNDEPPEIIE